MTDVKMPEPTYIWHEDRDDETSCEMYEVAVSGLVDTNDEIYANGKCNLCTRLFTEAQMLQFRKEGEQEALEKAADTCDSTMYVEGDRTISKYGPITYANVEIKKCADAIRALAKEIK